MKYIIDSSTSEIAELGGKAAALALLDEHGLNIPKWFAVRSGAYHDSPDGGIGGAVADEIMQHLSEFPDGTRFAVRSSAKAEDGRSASFAGQFDTFLQIEKADVLTHVVKVWRSAFSERVLEYRRINGIDEPVEPPAVLIQRMVDSEKSGVAFRVDPVTGNTGTCVINAVFGLGSALVDGSSNSDTYTFRYKDRTITKKETYTVLTDTETEKIALLVKATSDIFGHFQDIEWAIEGGELYLLQSRPITSLSKVFERTAKSFIFDNSNIAESYNGTTTPLTFSFIRKAYSGVYEQFCRLFGVSERVIEENMTTFSQMLAFVDNRVYYNLYSWYKMLSLLPGYTVNRAFMEQMMGVKNPLPEDFLEEVRHSTPSKGKFSDSLSLARSLFKLATNYFRLERHIKIFLKRLDAALSGGDTGLMTVNELCGHFRELEKKMLKRWDAPIENDFFAMIFHGLLKALCKKWGLPESVHNDVLIGQGGIISARPAAMIKEIAAVIADDHEAIRILSEGRNKDINRLLAGNGELKAKIDDYLKIFGHRCIDELKLESPSLYENPMPLYRSISASAQSKPDTRVKQEPADAKIFLKGKPIKRMLFGYILRNTRRLIKNRENLRFERTRLFGRIRSIFLDIGVHFASRGIISQKRDIFYLTYEEITGAVDSTAVSYDFKGIVRLRQAEMAKHGEIELPVRVFAAGVAGFSPRKYEDVAAHEDFGAGDEMHGTPCCAGRVTARARVVHDPLNTDFSKGEILIAKRTDPGWIVLFNLASGIIVEKGSLLSHASIVSREMGIPCIVAADEITVRITDGEIITMDGSTGKIWRASSDE